MGQLGQEQSNQTLVLTIDNPPVNVLPAKLIDALTLAFHSVVDNADIRSVILTGSGRKVFAPERI
jgi:enoyl-CoA hydratase